MRRSGSSTVSPRPSLPWLFWALVWAWVWTGCSPALRADNLVWDTDTGTDGAQAGSGTWQSGAPNWFNQTATTQNQNWVDGNAAFFAGADGTYVIDVLGPISATSLNFSNSGYTLQASVPSTITLTASSSAFFVSAGKTAVLGSGLTVTSLPSATAQFRGGGTFQIEGTVRTSASNVNFDIAGGTTVEVLAGGRLQSANSIVIGPQVGTGSVGTLLVSGGEVSTAATGANNNFLLGNVGGTTATVTMTDGSITVASDATTGLRLGFNATTTATFNLDGGVLTTKNVFGAAGAASTFNFNGGILRNNTSNAAFMQDIANANVKAGGARIETSGTITISQVLQHDADTPGIDGGLTKMGNGTLTLTGANTYNGATTLQRGVLNLDFAGSGATDSNIISSSSALVGNGGALSVTGADAEVNSQSFAGTTIASGQLTVTAVSGAGGTMNVDLGTVTRNLGAGAQFNLPASGTISAGGLTNTNGIIGGWAIAGTDWAVASGGAIAAYTGYLDYTTGLALEAHSGYSPTANLRVTAGSTGNVIIMNNTRPSLVEVNSILVNDVTARTISLGNAGPGNILRVGSSGGIALVSGAATLTVTLGTITSGDAANVGGELVLYNGNAVGGATMGVGSIIDDNGTGVVAVTKTGTGAVALSGNNTYTGGTSVAGGRLTVSGHANALGTGDVTVRHGAQLVLQGVSIKNDLQLEGTGAGTAAAESGALRVENQAIVLGDVSLLSDAVISNGSSGSYGTVRGVISGDFSISGGNGPGHLVLGGDNTYTGTTTTGSGNLIVGEGGTTGSFGSGNIVLGNGSVYINRSNTYVISQTISSTGTGDFHQYGTGTTVLTAANTFTGDVTAARGTLQLDFGAASAPLTNILNNNALSLRGGSMLVSGAAGKSNSQSFSSVTIEHGSSRLAATSGTGGSMNVVLNDITRKAGGTVDIILPATGSITTTTANAIFTDGSQTILGGYATVGGSTWAVSGTGGTPGAITGLATYNSGFAGGAGANIDVTAGASAGSGPVNSLRFNAAAAGSVDATGGLNVVTGGILVTSNVGANATSITGGTLTSGNGADLIVHQHNTAADFTIGSDITGGIGLTKTGAGTLVLAGANTYTGITHVTEGALSISSAGNLGASSSLVLNNGTLRVTSDLALTQAMTLGATTPGTHTAATSGTIEVAAGATFDMQGVISSSGSRGMLIKEGAGVLVLSGANTYAGGTQINAGILRLGLANRLAESGVNGGVHVASGAAFELNGFAETINSLTGAGTVRNGGAANVTLQIGVQGTASNSNGNVDFTFDGLLENGSGGGVLSINKAGLGVLTLTNANNSFSGSISVSNGVIETASIGNSGVNSAIGAGSIVLGGGTLRYTGGSATTNRFGSGAVTGHSFLDITEAGTILNITSAMTASSLTTASLTKRGAGTLEFTGTGQNTNLILIVDEGTVLLGKISGASSVSVFGLYVRSGATARLTGGNGNQIAGTVTEAASAGAKGIPQLDGTLDMNGRSEIVSLFNGDTTGLVTNGAVDTASLLSVGLTDTSAITDFAGIIEDGAGTLAFTKGGTSTQILSGNNTYTGITTVSNGVLQLGNGGTSGTAGNGTSIVVTSGTVRTSRSNLIELDQLISGAGSFEVNNTSTGITALTRAAGNTYSGGTTVNSGILLAENDSGSATGIGAVTINNGGVLGGTGIIVPTGSNNITINSGGSLAPGNPAINDGVGTLTIGSAAEAVDITVNAGGAMVFQLRADGLTGETYTSTPDGPKLASVAGATVVADANDRLINGNPDGAINFLGGVDPGTSKLVVEFTGGFTATAFQAFDLLDWVTFTGVFDVNGDGYWTLADDGTGNLLLPELGDGNKWDISMFASHGVLAAVPEPSRAMMLAAGAMTLLLRRRRSRRGSCSL